MTGDDCRLGGSGDDAMRRCWTHGGMTDVPPCPLAGSQPKGDRDHD